jgi:hypothetical protein
LLPYLTWVSRGRSLRMHFLAAGFLLHPLEALLLPVLLPCLLILDGLDVYLLDLELHAPELDDIVLPQLVVQLLVVLLEAPNHQEHPFGDVRGYLVALHVLPYGGLVIGLVLGQEVVVFVHLGRLEVVVIANLLDGQQELSLVLEGLLVVLGRWNDVELVGLGRAEEQLAGLGPHLLLQGVPRFVVEEAVRVPGPSDALHDALEVVDVVVAFDDLVQIGQLVFIGDRSG